jgi:hypothetical protein
MSLAIESEVLIRAYETGDIVAHLLPEYAQLHLDPALTWVVDVDGAVVGVLVAAYGSQTACLLRVAAVPSAPYGWLLALLRRAIVDLRERGCVVLVACLSAARPEELKLARLLQRAGGQLASISGYVGAVTIDQAGKW